jgi:hypothetical protein
MSASPSPRWPGCTTASSSDHPDEPVGHGTRARLCRGAAAVHAAASRCSCTQPCTPALVGLALRSSDVVQGWVVLVLSRRRDEHHGAVRVSCEHVCEVQRALTSTGLERGVLFSTNHHGHHGHHGRLLGAGHRAVPGLVEREHTRADLAAGTRTWRRCMPRLARYARFSGCHICLRGAARVAATGVERASCSRQAPGLFVERSLIDETTARGPGSVDAVQSVWTRPPCCQGWCSARISITRGQHGICGAGLGGGGGAGLAGEGISSPGTCSSGGGITGGIITGITGNTGITGAMSTAVHARTRHLVITTASTSASMGHHGIDLGDSVHTRWMFARCSAR